MKISFPSPTTRDEEKNQVMQGQADDTDMSSSLDGYTEPPAASANDKGFFKVSKNTASWIGWFIVALAGCCLTGVALFSLQETTPFTKKVASTVENKRAPHLLSTASDEVAPPKAIKLPRFFAEPKLRALKKGSQAGSFHFLHHDDDETATTTGDIRRKMQGGNPRLSIAEVIAQNPALQLLEAYVGFAGLLSEINAPGPFSMITPWDQPWESLENIDPQLFGKLRNPFWRAHLRDLLYYYLYDGDIPPDGLGDSQTYTMRNGEDITITRTPGTSRYFVNNVIVVADYEATNGHAYMPDAVLLPAWVGRNLLQMIQADFPTLASLVVQAGLDAALADPNGSMTVFAPDESAFASLGQDAAALAADNDLLTETLSYHLVSGGPIASINIISSLPRTYSTEQGQSITIAPGNPPTVQGVHNQADVTDFDRVANNGIVHVIDTVLLLGPIGAPSPTRAPVPGTCQCPDPPIAGEPPSNDNCDSALTLAIGGSPVIGSTFNATQQTRVSDVHYTFVGNGRRVRISTCSQDTTTPHNFVVRNGNCLTSFVSGSESFSDPACTINPNSASFEFDTVDGRAYPVHVYPRNSERQGQFAIQITAYANPSNDDCQQYSSLEINGAQVAGTTEGGTLEARNNDVHFAFTGNGRRVKVSTCSDQTTTAHNFFIRNGGCLGGLVGGSEVFSDPTCPGNPKAASFVFDTVDGTFYPINVYPRTSEAGPFAIRVTDFINPSNDYCQQYISLGIGGNELVGSTVNATLEARPYDVVYGIVGNGRRLRVSTCSSQTTTAHDLFIRNGGCTSSGIPNSVVRADFECEGNAKAAGTDFTSVAGRLYPIIVYPRNSDSPGQFAIKVIDYVPPGNDNCAQYVSLSIGGAQVVGSTVNATDATRPGDVFYAFTGTGGTVRVTTCADETTTAHNFLILNGGCTSGAVSGSEAITDPDCFDNANAAAFEFDTVPGRLYPIAVYPRAPGREGQFAIRVEEVSSGSRRLFPRSDFEFDWDSYHSGIENVAHDPEDLADETVVEQLDPLLHAIPLDRTPYTRHLVLSTPVEPCVCPSSSEVTPYNDACSQYQSLPINYSPLIGTSVGATLETRTSDVHYAFVGNGRRVRVSTCFDATVDPHNFLIRNGACTSGLVTGSETANDPTCTGNANAAAFEFDTLAGRLYPVTVFPRNSNSEGQFAIQVTDYISPPNDYCQDYISLQIGAAPVIGSTVNATFETRTSDVHYAFVGNGRRVRVSTCFDATVDPHNFLIRNGACTSFLVTGSETANDPTCTGNTNAAAFEFDSVEGTLYPVTVFPRNSNSEGQFAIQVTDYINPVNDDCSQYISLEIGGQPVIGSTVNATLTLREGDVFYGVIGNGNTVRVSTCFPETDTAHNFYVRNGNCNSALVFQSEAFNDPTCTGNPNAAAFEFDTRDRILYPIGVYPRNEDAQGQFAIQITEFSRPLNDDCDQYISLLMNGPPVIGSTMGATDQTRVDDVVYGFVGNGRKVRVTTCFDETTTPHSFVLRNGGCTTGIVGPDANTDPTCAGNANAAAFEFDTRAGRFYPVHVYPRNQGNEGQFAIQVFDYVNPENDYCEDYELLEIDGPPVIGSTVNATDDIRVDDVHYAFIGNGQPVSISTCFGGTSTAHNFVLLNGECSFTVVVGSEVSSDPTCAVNPNAAAFQFNTTVNTLYPIVVYPRNEGTSGDFVIQVIGG